MMGDALWVMWWWVVSNKVIFSGMHFFEKLKTYDIILASGSPRRRELLSEAGIPFRVEVRPVSEAYAESLDPVAIVYHLCQQKSLPFAEELRAPRTVVITADTIVAINNHVLNKPSTPQEAYAMLRMLSGQMHAVHTGVCIGHGDTVRRFHETTLVYFRDLHDEEIIYYINNYRPFDKAGSYGIQEWIGRVGITHIEGSYDNVVGFPVQRVYTALTGICL